MDHDVRDAAAIAVARREGKTRRWQRWKKSSKKETDTSARKSMSKPSGRKKKQSRNQEVVGENVEQPIKKGRNADNRRKLRPSFGSKR